MKNKLLLGLIVVLLQCILREPDTFFFYVPPARPEPKVKIEKTIGILPFKDLRPLKNKSNFFPYYLIPLVLWQTFENERPNKYEKKETFDSDLARALRNELKSLQLFKEIILNTSYYNKESDFKIEAEILSAKEIKTVTAYGVSFLYIYLHGSGLPSGNLENELKLKVKLFETKSKRILFEKTYEDIATRRQTQFNQDTIQFQNEIEIVQRMFPEIANDIVNAISKK